MIGIEHETPGTLLQPESVTAPMYPNSTRLPVLAGRRTCEFAVAGVSVRLSARIMRPASLRTIRLSNDSPDGASATTDEPHLVGTLHRAEDFLYELRAR